MAGLKQATVFSMGEPCITHPESQTSRSDPNQWRDHSSKAEESESVFEVLSASQSKEPILALGSIATPLSYHFLCEEKRGRLDYKSEVGFRGLHSF